MTTHVLYESKAVRFEVKATKRRKHGRPRSHAKRLRLRYKTTVKGPFGQPD